MDTGQLSLMKRGLPFSSIGNITKSYDKLSFYATIDNRTPNQLLSPPSAQQAEKILRHEISRIFSRNSDQIGEYDASDDESLAAPSPLPSDGRRFGNSYLHHQAPFKRSQESVISLMSSTTTSGLGRSQSPLIGGRCGNFHRSSNRRFSSRHFTPVLAGNSGAGSSRSSVAESHLTAFSSPRSQEVCQRWRHDQCGFKRSSSVMTSGGPTSIRKPLTPLPINPLPFDVPTVSEYEPFIGREWLYHELYEILVRPNAQNGMKGAVIYGDGGSGKTTVCYNLVRQTLADYVNFGSFVGPSPHSCAWRYKTSRALLAYHFCQIDEKSTCRLAEILLNLIIQCARHPLLYDYHEKLSKNLQFLSLKHFLIDPVQNFKRLFTDILMDLYQTGRLPIVETCGNFIIVIDALDESEYHRPEYGESIALFLLKHADQLFPGFVKLVLTTKTCHLDCVKGLALHKINLNDTVMDERVYTDAIEYVNMRVSDKLALRKNVSVPLSVNTKKSQNRDTVDSINNAADSVNRFVEHFVAVAKGNFLYMKLTLNLIERNHLIMKGANYKVLPVDLAETFLLMLNLKFPTSRSFEKVSSILSVMLASLNPLNGRNLFEIVNSNFVDEYISQEEFSQRLDVIQDYVVQKRNESFVLFHQAFRDWLTRRDENQSPKYLSDLRQGHGLIAINMCRKSGQLLDAEELQNLSHHLLKAHLYKKVPILAPNSSTPRDSQLYWLNLRAQNIKSSLCTDGNIYSPNTKVSRLLLLAGADANSVLDDGSTLLSAAVKHSRNEFAALLVEFGADANLPDQQGITPLIHAASSGNLDAVQFLHQHGAKLSQEDGEQKCALVHAAIKGRVDVLSFFLQCDWSEMPPPPTTANQNWSTKVALDPAQYSAIQKQRAVQQAFVAAAECGQLQACQFLHEFGDSAIDDQCPITKETALSIACLKCRSEIASYLIKNGSKLNYNGDMQRLSPLIRAVEGGCWEIVSALLAKEIDVNNERNEKLETALMKVAQTGHIGIMELLLSRDAQLNSVDSDGKTAFCWACIENRVSCASLLMDRGAKFCNIDNSGKSPIHYVAKNGSKQLVSLFLDTHPNTCQLLETCDAAGRRPLEIAIEAQNLEAVQKFLRKGAKLIPLTWQEAKSKLDIAFILLRKLADDGRILYKKNQIRDAEHRFRYALKKFETHFPNLDSDTIVAQPGYKQNGDNVGNNPRRLKHQLFLNLARCKRKTGDRAGALRSCTDAIDFEPDHSEGYYCRGRCYYESEMYEVARDDLFMVLKLEKSSTKTPPSQQRGNRDSCNSTVSGQSCRTNNCVNNNTAQFSKEATDLLLKINDILKRQQNGGTKNNNNVNHRENTSIMEMSNEDREKQEVKNWEQGSADSGNMPDIEALKV